jgi:hypothetical protein
VVVSMGGDQAIARLWAVAQQGGMNVAVVTRGAVAGVLLPRLLRPRAAGSRGPHVHSSDILAEWGTGRNHMTLWVHTLATRWHDNRAFHPAI